MTTLHGIELYVVIIGAADATIALLTVMYDRLIKRPPDDNSEKRDGGHDDSDDDSEKKSSSVTLSI